MNGVQLDLFTKIIDEDTLIREEIATIKKKHEALRKALFARHNDLYEIVMQQQKEIDAIKNFILEYMAKPECVCHNPSKFLDDIAI